MIVEDRLHFTSVLKGYIEEQARVGGADVELNDSRFIFSRTIEQGIFEISNAMYLQLLTQRFSVASVILPYSATVRS